MTHTVTTEGREANLRVVAHLYLTSYISICVYVSAYVCVCAPVCARECMCTSACVCVYIYTFAPPGDPMAREVLRDPHVIPPTSDQIKDRKKNKPAAAPEG